MLRAELRKTWTRPMVVITFVLVCLAQVFYVTTNYRADSRAATEAYHAFGGAMDEGWKRSVHEKFEELWPTPPQTTEYLWNATMEQRAILTAYDYTFFTDMLDNYVEGLKGYYGVDPNFDVTLVDAAYADLRTASENGELVFGMSPFGNSMANQYMIAWGFLIFMTILCVDQFSGEKVTGMTPMQHATKQGRQRLFWTKFRVCQVSALAVWLVINTVYGLTLLCCYGWGDLRSVVQDFNYNACPYDWNTGEFMSVVLSVSLVVSQMAAVVIFLLARVSGSTQRSFALIGGVLILPYLIAFQADLPGISLWLPCLMHGGWLWSGLRFWKVFGLYVQPWQLAAAEMVILTAASIPALRHFANLAESANES